MPYYYRRKWYRPNTRRRYYRYKRRNWIRSRRRRLRKTFPTFRRYRVRRFKLFKKRKLKYLPLRQWQPQLIRKCHIKGLFTLFQGAHGRFANNYPQYRDSYTPELYPGGGGWGIYVFNLGAFFDEFLRVRNWWTKPNVQLPLCRYCYCKLRFYRSDYVDYVVSYTNSYPMTDNEYRHAEAQPSRMMMRKKKVIVQSRVHSKGRKPYITKRINPPRQLINKWFFQREFVNVNLLMLTATSCSLTEYDLSNRSLSNNITLTTLNPKVFLNLNYDRPSETTGWFPKGSYYLYSTTAQLSTDVNNPLSGIKYKTLIYLGQATARRVGKSIEQSNVQPNTYFTKPEYWGNIFHEDFIHDRMPVLVSNIQHTAFATDANWNEQKEKNIESKYFTLMAEPIFIKVRYNPDKDTGKDTSIYFLPNFQQVRNWDPPENEQLKFHGFPLWMLLWGWPDWQKKLALINQIDQHYILIVNSPFFEPNLKTYMFLDEEFLNNTKPFPDPEIEHNKPILSDELSWHPKFEYQKKSVNAICMCGPGTAKNDNLKSIQAHMEYDFVFKWGGSPSNMETIADPSKQPSFAVPDNLATAFQIQDPRADPSTNIYSWDCRRDILTQKCIDRLKADREPDKTLFCPSDLWINPKPPEKERDLLQTLLEAKASEEEKKNKIQLYKLIRLKQHDLQQQLRMLMLQTIR